MGTLSPLILVAHCLLCNGLAVQHDQLRQALVEHAVSRFQRGLDSKIEETVADAVAELSEVGKEVTRTVTEQMRDALVSELVAANVATPVGLIETESESKPKHVKAKTNHTKKEKIKLEFNPFKSMIADINTAIDAVKTGLETSTAEVIHKTAAELRSTGSELGKELSNTLRTTVQGEILSATETAPQSMMQIDSKPAHKHHVHHKEAKKPHSKLEFNPFKSMIADINTAIGAVKEGLETSTREVVHQTAAELQSTGAQLGKELSNTLRATVQSEITAATVSEPVGKTASQ